MKPKRIELSATVFAAALSGLDGVLYTYQQEARREGLTAAEAERSLCATMLHLAALLAPSGMTATEFGELAQELHPGHLMLRSDAFGYERGSIVTLAELDAPLRKLAMLARQRRVRPCTPAVVAERAAKRSRRAG